MSTSTVRLALCGAFLLGCSSGAADRSATGGSGGETPEETGGSGGTPVTGGSGGKASGGSGGQVSPGGSGGQVSTGGSGGQVSTGGSGGQSSGGSGGGESGGSGGTADAGAPAGDGGMPVTFPGMHASCPSCKAIFDGKTLTGWTSFGKAAGGVGPVMGNWDVQGGALHSIGTARNVLATSGDYNNFRLIFSIKHSGGNHQPCIVIWGRRPPPNDAMGGIQIQAPHTNMWDYRPGQNKNIGGMKVGSTPINDAQWSQCEVLAKGTAGDFRMACCQQDATGDKPCKGVELLHFAVAGAGNNGPISLQAHNSGVHDEYKNIFIEEDPAVNDLLTTK